MATEEYLFGSGLPVSHRASRRDAITSNTGDLRPVSGGDVVSHRASRRDGITSTTGDLRPVSGGGTPVSHRADRRDEPTSGAGLAPVSPARARFEQAWGNYEEPAGTSDAPPTYAGTGSFAPTEPVWPDLSGYGQPQGYGQLPLYHDPGYDEPGYDALGHHEPGHHESDEFAPAVYPYEWPEFEGDSRPTEELVSGRGSPIISHRKREPVRRAAVRVLAAVLVAGGGVGLVMNFSNHTGTSQAAPVRTDDDASRGSLRPTSEDSATPAPSTDPSAPADPATDPDTASAQTGGVRNAPAVAMPVPTSVPSTTAPPTTVPPTTVAPTTVPPTTVPPTTVAPTTVPPTTVPPTTVPPTTQAPVTVEPTTTAAPASTEPTAPATTTAV